MVKCTTISANKGNRLYWLGRYTERVYLSLHLLRKYYDKMIDGNPVEYGKYYEKLDVVNTYNSVEEFQLGEMYDKKNPNSLISGLIKANDNAIVLREDIASESLSYIQLSLVHLTACANKKEDNITNLQPITDYLLAFWGSIYERVFDKRIKAILMMGKLVEHVDYLLRFDYPFNRVEEAYRSLTDYSYTDPECFDPQLLHTLDEMIIENVFVKNESEYKSTLIKYLNQLILL